MLSIGMGFSLLTKNFLLVNMHFLLKFAYNNNNNNREICLYQSHGSR